MDPGKEDYENLGEEPQVEAPKPTAKVVKPAEAPVEAAPVAVPESRYVAYHAKEEKGVVDRETGRLLPDLDSQMAELLNKMDNMEKSVG